MLRKFLPYTSTVVVLALIYVVWIIWSRRHENARIEQQLKIEEGKRDAQIVRMYGGDELKILSFYASPPTIRHGQTALLCYGVNNATKVQISPTVGGIAPSLSRCVEVRPSSSTTFTLTTEDAKGHELSESFTLQVLK